MVHIQKKPSTRISKSIIGALPAVDSAGGPIHAAERAHQRQRNDRHIYRVRSPRERILRAQIGPIYVSTTTLRCAVRSSSSWLSHPTPLENYAHFTGELTQRAIMRFRVEVVNRRLAVGWPALIKTPTRPPGNFGGRRGRGSGQVKESGR